MENFKAKMIDVLSNMVKAQIESNKNKSGAEVLKDVRAMIQENIKAALSKAVEKNTKENGKKFVQHSNFLRSALQAFEGMNETQEAKKIAAEMKARDEKEAARKAKVEEKAKARRAAKNN